MKIHYKLNLPENQTKEFEVELDSNSLALIHQKRDTYPDWTRLEYEQCPNCPLESDKTPHCPIAANLVDVIDFCKTALSYEETTAEITTDQRTYQKKTDLQTVLGSLVGIFMVSSGCPIMDKMRPLVRTHLPFSSMEETIYRLLSMYLLAQFFKKKNGMAPDWELKDLSQLIDEIQKINIQFRMRLKSISAEDAGLNAVVKLDTQIRFLKMLLDDQQLEDIEKLFNSHLNSKD